MDSIDYKHLKTAPFQLYPFAISYSPSFGVFQTDILFDDAILLLFSSSGYEWLFLSIKSRLLLKTQKEKVFLWFVSLLHYMIPSNQKTWWTDHKLKTIYCLSKRMTLINKIWQTLLSNTQKKYVEGMKTFSSLIMVTLTQSKVKAPLVLTQVAEKRHFHIMYNAWFNNKLDTGVLM